MYGTSSTGLLKQGSILHGIESMIEIGSIVQMGAREIGRRFQILTPIFFSALIGVI